MGTPVDFAKGRKEAEASGAIGAGDYLKLREGDNRMRLMSKCLPHQSVYKGNKTFKWLCYVIDRRDGTVKPFFMPHRVYKQIEALQTNEEYAFVEVPMPYDITIAAKKAGTKDVEYTVMPARKETPLTNEELNSLDSQKSLEELQSALKEKASADAEQGLPPDYQNPEQPPELTDEDIPFMKGRR